MNDIASDRVGPRLNPPHLGEPIRVSMDDAGWSVTETAARLRCERGTRSRLLNGKADGGWMEYRFFAVQRNLLTDEDDPDRGYTVVGAYSVGNTSGENPTFSDVAEWHGVMFGRDTSAGPSRGELVGGAATVTVTFAAGGSLDKIATVSFTDIAEVASGDPRGDMSWLLDVVDGTFGETLAPDDTIWGQFYGPNEEERLAASSNATRSQGPLVGSGQRGEGEAMSLSFPQSILAIALGILLAHFSIAGVGLWSYAYLLNYRFEFVNIAAGLTVGGAVLGWILAHRTRESAARHLNRCETKSNEGLQAGRTLCLTFPQKKLDHTEVARPAGSLPRFSITAGQRIGRLPKEPMPGNPASGFDGMGMRMRRDVGTRLVAQGGQCGSLCQGS